MKFIDQKKILRFYMGMYETVIVVPSPPTPLGTTRSGNTVFLSLYSAHATAVYVGLFKEDKAERIIALKKTGNIWHVGLRNLPPNSLYAYQCHGEWNEATGDLYDPSHWLLDPYAKFPHTSKEWHQGPLKIGQAKIADIPKFDWQNTERPHHPKESLIIYEMHIRGFNGTYAGAIEKIPYLKKLGINAVELLPVFEFDESHCKNAPLPNYWGYNTLSFFAPKQSYAAGDAITEFKTFVREFHKAGIEVILDVVYNHSCEGSEKDYAISWRGIDNRAYYLKEDFTGCGNTFNANATPAKEMILDSLRYWANEMQVDGFRFDLASSLTRGPDGMPMDNPPLIVAIALDPVLSKLKLISESWDFGLYQVGHFPKWGPWSEWNGLYRDWTRKFLKGTDNLAGDFAQALTGSERIYGYTKSPSMSINFITSHDGFTLRDLVTYQEKHNWENGEQNKDGNDQNDNWNCGIEGPTENKEIIQLRERQMCNHLVALFISQGIPMLLMGDEYGHTRRGNNNPYVQDNALNWFLWDELEKRLDIFNFVRELISLRKSEDELSLCRFLTDADITWHGQKPNQPNWSSRLVAFSTKTFYIAFNAENSSAEIELPREHTWSLLVNTETPWKFQAKTLPNTVHLLPHSVLIAKKIS